MIRIVFLLVFTTAIVIVIAWCMRKSTDGFGGPVKSVRRIPYNACATVCDHHYNNCIKLEEHKLTPVCQNAYDVCIAECYYSRVHKF